MDARDAFKRRLTRASELVVRARVHLDIYLLLVRQESIDEHIEALEISWDFFRFTREAHAWVYYVRICSLLSRKSNTVNLPALVKQAEKIFPKDRLPHIAKAQDHLSQTLLSLPGVKSIRDKAVAHQNEQLTQPEVFQSAKINLPLLLKLSDGAFDVVNELRASIGMSAISGFAAPHEALRDMLVRAKRLNHGMIS